MFFRKSKPKRNTSSLPYDPATQTLAIRCSICTGEQTLGFKDKDTGRFHEYLLIRTEDELKAFMAEYGLKDIEKIY